MTLQRNDEGTGRYVPPSATGFNPDVFGLARPPQFISGIDTPLGQSRYFVQKFDKAGDIYYWRWEIYDLRGGLNLQRGPIPLTHNRMAGPAPDPAVGLCEPTESGLIIPLATESLNDSSISFTGTLGCHWANCFDRLVIGQGSVANHSLFKETSATNPALTAMTFTPGGIITAMAPLVINSSSTGTKRLCIFYTNDNGDVLDDLTPTVNGTTFHAGLNDTRGAIQTFLNTQTILFLVSATGTGDAFCIKTLKASDAINTAPTTVLQNVPANGYALGMLSLGGGPVRAWWVWGETRNSGGTSVAARTEKGHITSTNLQGTDPQELFVGLPFIYDAVIVNGGIACSDGKSLRFHNGRTIQDLGIFKNRIVNSDRVYRVAGLGANGDELIAEVNLIASTSGTGNTYRWFEAYNFNLGTWRPIGNPYEPGSTGIRSQCFAGGMPISETTRYIQTLTLDKTFYGKYLPERGVDPYSLRKSSGAQATTGLKWEAGGKATLPASQIPGLEGWPLVVRRISGNPQLEIGGGTPTTNPSVAVSVGGVSCTFVYGQTQGRQEFPHFDNGNVVYELQPVITLTQQSGGTDPTRTTPQALPIIIEGLAMRPDFQAGADFGDFSR